MHLIKKMEIKAKRTVVLPSPRKQKERTVREEIVELVDPSELDKLSLREDNGHRSPVKFGDNSIESFSNKTALDFVTEHIKQMDTMKKNEIARIFKQYLPKSLEDRLKMFLMKTFRYLFGRREGEELVMKFLKEKRVYYKSNYHSNDTILLDA